MNQYTEIADVPTDLEVVDSMGFTWKYMLVTPLHSLQLWHYRVGTDWVPSSVAARGASTAFMGPFAEVR
ncbi:hypothetical protein [Mycolicibacterium houstonense]|uniref:hypothetical protein n=1 Tax=Mycolicibacterium houstonense TaxID=146021 RepID=UPI000836DC55|nr:hypothetical protein [Mycolicibacterium houstonense]